MSIVCNSLTDGAATNLNLPIASIASATTVPKLLLAVRFRINAIVSGAHFTNIIYQPGGAANDFLRLAMTSGSLNAAYTSAVQGRTLGSTGFTGRVGEIVTVAFLYDTAIPTAEMRWFVNGVQIFSQTDTGGVVMHATNPLAVGSHAANTIDIEFFEFGYAETYGDPATVLAALNTNQFGNVLEIDWLARYSAQDETSGAATNGSGGFFDLEGGGNHFTVRGGAPIYANTPIPAVPLFGKAATFDPVTAKHAGNLDKLAEFFAGKHNVIVLSDSFGVTNTPARMANAIAATWPQAHGWSAHSVGVAAGSGGGPARWFAQSGMTFPAGGGYVEGIIAGGEWFDGTAIAALPGEYAQWHVGTDFAPATANRAGRVVHRLSEPYGFLPDWQTAAFDGGRLRVGLYSVKHGDFDSVASLGFDDTSVLGESEIDLSGDPVGWTYHGEIDYVTNNGYFYSTADWASGDKYCTIAGVRWTDPTLDGSEMLIALANNSWSVIGHSNPHDVPNELGGKRYTASDLVEYLQAVPDKTKPLWVVLWIAQESVGASEQRTQLYNIKQKYKAACAAVGMTFGGFIVVAPWRTGDLSQTEIYAEAAITLAERDPDGESFALNVYALSDGLLLDASTDAADQIAWAAANGFSNLTTAAGNALNLGTLNMLDGSKLHPGSEAAAHGFAYVTGRYMARLLAPPSGGRFGLRIGLGIGF